MDISKIDEILEQLKKIASDKDTVTQLTRIADALEGQHKAGRSWAAIYGSAEKHLNKQTRNTQAYEAMKLWGKHLSTEHGTDPAVFPIISTYPTVDAMIDAIRDFLNDDRLNWDEGSIEDYAVSIGYILRDEGLWDY